MMRMPQRGFDAYLGNLRRIVGLRIAVLPIFQFAARLFQVSI